MTRYDGIFYVTVILVMLAVAAIASGEDILTYGTAQIRIVGAGTIGTARYAVPATNSQGTGQWSTAALTPMYDWVCNLSGTGCTIICSDHNHTSTCNAGGVDPSCGSQQFAGHWTCNIAAYLHRRLGVGTWYSDETTWPERIDAHPIGTFFWQSGVVVLDLWDWTPERQPLWKELPYILGEQPSCTPVATCPTGSCVPIASRLHTCSPAVSVSNGCVGGLQQGPVVLTEALVTCSGTADPWHPVEIHSWSGLHDPSLAHVVGSGVWGVSTSPVNRLEWCRYDEVADVTTALLVWIENDDGSPLARGYWIAQAGEACDSTDYTTAVNSTHYSTAQALPIGEFAEGGIVIEFEAGGLSSTWSSSSEAIISRLDELLEFSVLPGEDESLNTPDSDASTIGLSNAGGTDEINGRLWDHLNSPDNLNDNLPDLNLGAATPAITDALFGLKVDAGTLPDATALNIEIQPGPGGPTFSMPIGTGLATFGDNFPALQSTLRLLVTSVCLVLLIWKSFHWILWGLTWSQTVPQEKPL